MLHVIIPTTGGAAFDAMWLAYCRWHDGYATGGSRPVVTVMASNGQAINQAVRDVCRCVDWKRRVGYVDAVNGAYALLRPQKEFAPLSALDYVAVLNDDVIVEGDWITPLMAALKDGAAQVGPSVHHVGRDGFWGRGDEPYQFVEGWCWMASVGTIEKAAAVTYRGIGVGGIYDSAFSPGYCEDQDLSIRTQKTGGKIQQVDVPIRHLRSQTFGKSREPWWSRNRQYLIQKWRLDESQREPEGPREGEEGRRHAHGQEGNAHEGEARQGV